MIFLFPLANESLSSSEFYRFMYSIFKGLFPNLTFHDFDGIYIVIRKLIHLFGYAFLAFLLFRAFQGFSTKEWNPKWILYAAVIAVGYGMLDEFIQTYLPNRHGNVLDVLIDTSGILLALGSVWLRKRKTQSEGWSRYKMPTYILKALFLKRPFDICLSALGICLSFPIWIILAVLIWIEDKGPIFYKQERVGKNGRLFNALKFRSMIKEAEREGIPVQAVENDPRVTKMGKLMRSTALDELPQLVNIFTGDMSFVGPRALRPREKEVGGGSDTKELSEIPGYVQRQAVRPGLTGLAQVFLPTDATRRKKFKYDIFYIRKRSFWLDLKLIFLSFWITFRGKWESRTDKV